MEITKNLIHYKHNNFSKISNFNFGGQYKDNTGRLHQLKDINGLDNVFVTNQASFILNKSIESDVITDDWLKNHPEIKSAWTRTDIQEKEAIETKETLTSAQAIIEAAKMTDADVKTFAQLSRFNVNASVDVLRAKAIKVAQENHEKFMSIHFDPEKNLRVFILDALKAKKLKYKNETFYYGKEAVGTNEEQVLVWLKDNKDILAILKHEIRGEEKPKKKLVKK